MPCLHTFLVSGLHPSGEPQGLLEILAKKKVFRTANFAHTRSFFFDLIISKKVINKKRKTTSAKCRPWTLSTV